jgi:hypothetical protein
MKPTFLVLLLATHCLGACASSQPFYHAAHKFKESFNPPALTEDREFPQLRGRMDYFGARVTIDENGNHVPLSPTVDFAADCGIVPVISGKDELFDGWDGFDAFYKFSESVGKSNGRTTGYLEVLKLVGQYDGEARRLHDDIAATNEQLLALVKADLSIFDKKMQALPLFARIVEKSYALAKLGGFNYEGGCGAGEEDSQTVFFAAEPPPRILRFIDVFDYKTCESIGADPLRFDQCDLWEDVIRDGPYYLSGDYHIFAAWQDGSQKRLRFSATSKSPSTLRITK